MITVHAHFGYLVLVVLAGFGIYFLASQNLPRWRAAAVGLLDLEVLLGLIAYFSLAPAVRPIWWHPAVGIVVAVLAHIAPRWGARAYGAVLLVGAVLIFLLRPV